jgi:hypothetical protein
MLPIELITILFSVNIASATSQLAAHAAEGPFLWFAYLYLVFFRTKVYLDDLVYYRNIKEKAIGGGDPIVGLLSWELWIMAGISITRPAAYFWLSGVTFTLGVGWMAIAKRNLRNARDVKERKFRKSVEDAECAHDRWLISNSLSAAICYVYAVLCTVGATDWQGFWHWTGPAALVAVLLWDFATDYRYMLRLTGRRRRTRAGEKQGDASN